MESSNLFQWPKESNKTYQDFKRMIRRPETVGQPTSTKSPVGEVHWTLQQEEFHPGQNVGWY